VKTNTPYLRTRRCISSLGSVLDDPSKFENWFVDAHNGAISDSLDGIPIGISTDSASINRHLGLEDDSSVRSRCGVTNLAPTEWWPRARAAGWYASLSTATGHCGSCSLARSWWHHILRKMIVFTIMPLNDWNILLEMFLGVNY
jgi:hypothetical protein